MLSSESDSPHRRLRTGNLLCQQLFSFINNQAGAQVWSHHQLYTRIRQEAPLKDRLAHSPRAKADPLITTSPDAQQCHPNNRKHRNNKAEFMSYKKRERKFTHSCISRSVELPLGREGGNATCFNLSKQRCCIAFFPLLSPSAPGGKRCWLFALLLSCG